MIKWYYETYLTRERHACAIKGVGVVAIERDETNGDWWLSDSDLHGRWPLCTPNLEDAKRKALGQIHETVTNMMRAMDEAIRYVDNVAIAAGPDPIYDDPPFALKPEEFRRYIETLNDPDSDD